MSLWTMHSLNWKKSASQRRRRLGSTALDRGRAAHPLQESVSMQTDLISMFGGNMSWQFTVGISE
jgi:hypothetical protein